MTCRRCGCEASKQSGGKELIRVQNRTLVIRDDGRVEISCPQCKHPIELPLRQQEIRVGRIRIRP